MAHDRLAPRLAQLAGLGGAGVTWARADLGRDSLGLRFVHHNKRIWCVARLCGVRPKIARVYDDEVPAMHPETLTRAKQRDFGVTLLNVKP